MDNPGVFTLAALNITAATPAAGTPQTAIVDLDGAIVIDLEFAFGYGSGGTTCSAVVQTTFDGGTSWRDIARADFTTASAVKTCALKDNSKAMTAYVALAAEGVNDSLIGNALRCVVLSTGTYVNTTLSVRAHVK